MDIEAIGKQIVDSAIKVHRALGPGLDGTLHPLECAHRAGVALPLSPSRQPLRQCGQPSSQWTERYAPASSRAHSAKANTAPSAVTTSAIATACAWMRCAARSKACLSDSSVIGS